MATKVVNGQRRKLTRQEEQEHAAVHPPRPPRPQEPTDAAVIVEALTNKNVLTQGDLNSARARLKG
ncbi:MAG: hypothetical protein ACR2OV_15870 [Hyphomicrobiaceae bacterium]